uniref:Uncharacterized protein n=1 Tax=Candidatus Kentrum sp. SD TaxID=2126332 RepID=A0A450YZX6_9GAMM|nr:MAG: hypothetical protein BECKSD772F_GA0070984_109812 [Candidatus Kentron sp. SD]VFK47080.1 MAG: hypothetical protein BECKSD772E_GA0070983_108713 [Candidatus Kentron sp. SD]
MQDRLDRQTLEQRVRSIPDLAQIVFAFRSASRILPLFACRGHVDFWDDRAREYLKSNFDAIRILEYMTGNDGKLTSDQVSIAKSIAGTVYESYSKAIEAFNSGRREAGRVADAAYVVYCAIYVAVRAESYNRHIAAVNTAINSCELSLVSGSEFSRCVTYQILGDIDRLDASGQDENSTLKSIAEEPLWRGNHPPELPDLGNALERLLSEHTLSDYTAIYVKRLKGEAFAESCFEFETPGQDRDEEETVPESPEELFLTAKRIVEDLLPDEKNASSLDEAMSYAEQAAEKGYALAFDLLGYIPTRRRRTLKRRCYSTNALRHWELSMRSRMPASFSHICISTKR